MRSGTHPGPRNNKKPGTCAAALERARAPAPTSDFFVSHQEYREIIQASSLAAAGSEALASSQPRLPVYPVHSVSSAERRGDEVEVDSPPSSSVALSPYFYVL